MFFGDGRVTLPIMRVSYPWFLEEPEFDPIGLEPPALDLGFRIAEARPDGVEYGPGLWHGDQSWNWNPHPPEAKRTARDRIASVLEAVAEAIRS